MNGMKPIRFCAALECVYGLTAVGRAWREALGEDWPWARSLLRPTGELAECYPKPQGHRGSSSAYRIVWTDEGTDRYIGTCPDGDGAIELSRDDLIVLELDQKTLASRLAAAIGLVFDHRRVDGVRGTARIGTLDTLTPEETSVYLVLQAGPAGLSDTLCRMVVAEARPFLLFTPTRENWPSWPPGVADRVRVFAMDESFVVTRDGHWLPAVSFTTPPTPVAGGRGRRTGRAAPPPPSSRSYTPDRNEEVVLRVLAKATALMVQIDISTATKAFGRKLSRKTVGKTLTTLEEHGFVERKTGRQKGVRITEAGRELIAPRRRASH